MASKGTKPAYWDEAVEHLKANDRILNKIIQQYEGEYFAATTQGAFSTLARSLISVQSSEARANQVWRNLVHLCGQQPTVQCISARTVEQLLAIGIAKRKAGNLIDLANHFEARTVNPKKWSKMSDQEVINELCQIRGIGAWTAQMFLIFNLHRPNVLPLEDARLLKAVSKHYFSGEPVSRFEVRELADNWQPWQTVATWYMWRSMLDDAVA
ncbi:DNA-3-methyladenine glycosylase [Oligella sp. HMSC09E12]|uniref:DNA-3-methyladenine glycosylase family protein n=1 Tax=Oligella sp. HMSC09E12 TaxID=1581147 RepID=UPI0008A5EB27|nr:DNA-3-methyladenine glycosylase [Oligella sp. HMSC09E12]OFV50619.1 DNA-3-methyladenine glycosylase [Oligella sp. HMSC09E12]